MEKISFSSCSLKQFLSSMGPRFLNFSGKTTSVIKFLAFYKVSKLFVKYPNMLYYFYWANGIFFSMNWSSTTLFTAMKGNESDINSTYVHTNCMQVINIHENLKRGKFNATLLVEDNFSHSFEAWIYGVVCHCKIKVYSLYILFKPISLSSVRHGVRSRKMVQIVPLTNFKLVIR